LGGDHGIEAQGSRDDELIGEQRENDLFEDHGDNTLTGFEGEQIHPLAVLEQIPQLTSMNRKIQRP